MKEKTIHLNIGPLSANQCFTGRRFKTPVYKYWREEIGYLLMNQRPATPHEWCEVELDFHVNNYGMLDVDNMTKSLLDALVEARILKDDRYVKSIKSTKHIAKDRLQFIKISIKPYLNPSK